MFSTIKSRLAQLLGDARRQLSPFKDAQLVDTAVLETPTTVLTLEFYVRNGLVLGKIKIMSSESYEIGVLDERPLTAFIEQICRARDSIEKTKATGDHNG